MASVNADLLDKSVSHQIGLLRHSGSIRNKLVAHLNRVEDDLIKQIRDRADRGSFSEYRLNKILEDVRDILSDARPDTLGIVRDELTELSRYESGFQQRLLERTVPVDLSFTTPGADQLRSVVTSRPFQGKLLREWVRELDDASRRRIRDAVRIGFTEGESIDQIVRRVRGTRARGYRDGIMEVGRRQAEAMVRTAVNHTASAARDSFYQANRDLMKGERWVSTLDAATTEICMARDGNVYPLDSGPRPPAHIGCRSTTTPVLKSWRELGIDLDEAPPGTRASMDGQVPDDMTYNSWLKGQPASVQDEALGPTKAKLFREGGLSVDRFVDPKGEPYTLRDLARRDAEAFDLAGVEI